MVSRHDFLLFNISFKRVYLILQFLDPKNKNFYLNNFKTYYPFL